MSDEAGDRRVDQTEVSLPDGRIVRVSTVALPPGEGYGGRPYETMVFHTDADGGRSARCGGNEVRRQYDTIAEAVRGHDQMAEELKDGSLEIDPSDHG